MLQTMGLKSPAEFQENLLEAGRLVNIGEGGELTWGPARPTQALPLSPPAPGEGHLNHASQEQWMSLETSHLTSDESSGRPGYPCPSRSEITAHVLRVHVWPGPARGGRGLPAGSPSCVCPHGSSVSGLLHQQVRRMQRCSQGNALPPEKSSLVFARKHLSHFHGEEHESCTPHLVMKHTVQVLGLLLMVSINSSLQKEVIT